MNSAAVLLLLLLTACELRDTPQSAQRSRETVAARSSDASVALPADVGPTPAHPPRFGSIGRSATASEIRLWDIDANPAGVGLPVGRGTYSRGATVYAQQCARCHGVKGEGIAPNPRLVGAEPRDFSFATDPKLPKTIGNYWPYATTLYDYINRSMPIDTPGSLRPSDVYSVIAFLLAENGIIDTAASIDARSLPRVRMKSRDRFVTDDRIGSTAFR